MDNPNIILIVADTLRRDGIEPYGHRASTPNIRRFAADSVVFDNAVSPAPWTVPSHASLFSGMYPSELGLIPKDDTSIEGLTELARERLSDLRTNSIASELAVRGYTTYALAANPYISHGTGFDEGFDILTNIDFTGSYIRQEVADVRKKYGELSISKIPEILSRGGFSDLFKLYGHYRRLNKFLVGNGMPLFKGGNTITSTLFNSSLRTPFFLFLNLMEMHDPYKDVDFKEYMHNSIPGRAMLDLYGIKPFSRKFIENLRNAYFTQSEIFDNIFGQLIYFLKSNGIYDQTMIILTSDHGQALRERNFYGHGIFLYDEIVRIPLIVKLPSNRKFPVSQGYQSLVGLKDIITNGAEEKVTYDVLSRESVFSEEPRINRLTVSPEKVGIEREFLSGVQANRKVVYKNGFKVTVNGETGRFEEFMKNGKIVSPNEHKEIFRDLLYELAIFKGSAKFKVDFREEVNYL